MSKRKRGFTLIELLVVIAVVGILMGLLLPAVQRIRESARQVDCKNKLRQTALATQMYHSKFGELPVGWMSGDDPLDKPGWAWSTRILPYIDAKNLYHQIDWDAYLYKEEMQEVRKAVLKVFLCPSDPAPSLFDLNFVVVLPPSEFPSDLHIEKKVNYEIQIARSNYSGVLGDSPIEPYADNGNGLFYRNSQIPFRSITDGLSQTFMFGERRAERVKSTWVGVIPELDHAAARVVGTAEFLPNDRQDHIEAFSSWHPGGAHFAFAGGSVRMIHDTINSSVYRAMATRSGGETLGANP